ncbi:hypothetical protein K4K60_009918 [Colletotrichum sp. SAR11_57]|nr:hypothetical protein K4K60_009918 [Colletotrichum sp. SAR11_57]
MRDLWESDREVAVAYQFYKMGNESETPMTACLNLAKMLLEERFKADDKVPDQIMAIIKAHPPNETWLRKLIELLVREFKAVYIFVDGLDEMVDAAEKNRWPRAEDFLKFILRLAVGARSPDDDFDTVVKVWVSSQTRQKIIEAIFSSIPATSIVSTSSPPGTTALAQIPLTRKLNESDISAMFRYTMTVARSYDTFGGSEGINKVLEKVQLAVKGNFLWARLMIDSIANANSPAQAMEASETVPEDFGTYLGNRIKAQLEKHPQRRRDAALILSCLLYAQRPILVDELCDAVCAARIPTSGRNVRKEDRLFKDKIEEICAPLVKVNRLNRDDQTEQQNIDTHAFLTYCAKYWARHQELEHAMSTLPESRRDEIYEFVSSSQFRTTLQVQSLFVEAQFGFMLSTGHEEEGVHLVRAFPRFFTETEEFPIGKRVQQQYNEAIGEFGYYLNSLSRFHEQLAGQIDRCLWGMLGKSNMFRRVSSHLRSFKLETKRTPDDEARYLYHDNVIMSNKGITIFSVSSRSTGKNIRLELETFEVKPGHGDDFWNDWFSDDEDLQIDDITNDNIMNDSDELRFHQSLEDIFEESAIATTFDEKSDIASQLSAGHLDDVWSSSDESDNPEVVFHDDRRKPPNPGSTGVAGVRTHLCELLVLNTDSQT